MNLHLDINITPVFIEDKEVGGFTTYFREYPQAIGDGDTKELALQNLKNVFAVMLVNEPEILKPIILAQLNNISINTLQLA